MRAALLYNETTGHVLGGFTDLSNSWTDVPTVVSLLGENRSLELPVLVPGGASSLALSMIQFRADQLKVIVTTDAALVAKPFNSLGVTRTEPQAIRLLPSGSVTTTGHIVDLPNSNSLTTQLVVEAHWVGGARPSRARIDRDKKTGIFDVPPVTPFLLLVEGYEPKWIV